MKSKFLVLFDYNNLKNNLYVGQFGEQLVKLNFIINNFDVYEPQIDDKGIDFIARINDDRYFDIQVKTIRLKKQSYIYITKKTWNNQLRKNLLVAFVILEEKKQPTLLLIPATAWKTDVANKILVDRDYENKKSLPEWGITFNEKNLEQLKKQYDFETILEKIESN